MVFDLLSVDVDFYVAKGVLEAGYRPAVVVQEVNSNWGVDESYTVAPNGRPGIVGRCIAYWGMSQMASMRLYRRFGYSLVYVEREGVSAFFIQDGFLLDHALGASVHDIHAPSIQRSGPAQEEHVQRRVALGESQEQAGLGSRE